MLVRLLQWLLSHFVFLAVAGFLVWGFLWRDALLPRPATPQADQLPTTAEQMPGAASQAPAAEGGPSTRSIGHSAPASVFRPAADQGSAPAERPDLRRLLQAARRAYWEDDLAGAEARYRELLARYPDSTAGYGELGNLLLATGREAEAREAFRQALIGLRAEGDLAAVARLERYLGAAGGPVVPTEQ